MKDERKAKLKKQLISGGIYIALAATVVAITTRGITSILSGGDGYESPDFNIDDNLFDNGESKLSLPEIPDIMNEDWYYGNLSPVGKNPPGIDAQIENAGDREQDDSSRGAPSQSAETPRIGQEAEPETAPERERENDASDVGADIEYPTDPEGNAGYSLYVKPVGGYICKEYSPDELIYSPTMYDYRTHNGIDITGELGAQVKAFAAGKVLSVYDDPLMGKSVILDHGDGLTSCYMNLYESVPPNIATGAWINVGEVIGGVGESAICEVAEIPHLHFEIRLNGVPQDPGVYLRQSSME